jgi:hypothetical protein
MSSKKFFSAAIMATTLVWALGVAALPVASAQTSTDLQSQINALLAQIAQMKAQLGTTSTSTGTSSSYSFTHSLTVGSKGADVTALQQLLISNGDLTAVTAPTGYFGAATKAALAKYQAANGISPAAGYFGPKTMAYVASNSTGTSTGTGTGTSTSTTGTVAPATGLAVSLSSSNPVAGSLISSNNAGSARVPVLAVNFTAGNAGAATISDVKFHKTGVLSDSSVAGAYLTQNGKVVAQYTSLSNGVIDFSGLALNVSAGQTVSLTLAIDVSGGLSAGNTVGFAMNAASDVTAVDASNNAITSSGVFPLNGNTFTVTNVSNPPLASVGVAANSIGTQVTAGTQGNLVGAWNFTVQNNKVYLKGLNFHVIGSVNKGDLRNVKLYVNGTQVGSTLATVGADGTAFFDASATPGVLNTGSNNVQVFADVMGSPSYTFEFDLLNGYDVYAIDSQYNVPVTSGAASALSAITIQNGQITTTQDANTPTGNIAKGQSQVTIAKFDIYAAGEAVKVKYLPFSLVFNANASTTNLAFNQLIQNVSLVDDAGGQVGSTINQPPSSNGSVTPVSSGLITAVAGGTVTYSDSFGTANSPINYTVPANTTRVLSLKADIQSGASFNTVVGSLLSATGNLQGMISSKSADTAGAQGSSLSLSNSSLTVAANSALGTQSISAGVSNQKIGSYAFTASSAEGVNVNNLSVEVAKNVSGSKYFQNLKVYVNGTQFGTTIGTLAGGQTYTFSGTQFSVPLGGTVNVDIYADTLSSVTQGTSVSPATTLTSLSATGATSFSAISLASSVDGQALNFAGASTISIGTDSTQPAAAQVVMGSTGNTLAIYRFTETTNVENVKVTDLTVNDTVTATSTVQPKAAFSNVTLYNGTTALGTAGSAAVVSSVSGTAVYAYTFHFSTPIVVPQANSVSVSLKGDASTYSSAGATDNSVHTFAIAAATALGATSNKTATTTLGVAAGNPMTVLRSTLTATAAALGSTNGRSKSNPDDFGTVTFTANSQGAASLNKVAITLTGSAATSALLTTANVSLIDANGANVVTAGEATSTVSNVTGVATWTFVPGFQISAGGSYTFKLRLNTGAVNGTPSVSQSLSANIQASTDVSYTDGLDSLATVGLGLPTSQVPLTINSVSYAQGN